MTDAATSRPLPGARVLLVWEGEVDVLVDSQVARIRHCQTTSDVNGRFRVAAWRAPGNVIGRVRARAYIHLRGYNARPADSATEHTGPELVMHPLYSVTPGEDRAQDDLVFANERACAERYAGTLSRKLAPPSNNNRGAAMGLAKEFKEFAMKGSVVDLAIGVIIGAAFGKIVTSLVEDIIMPPLGKVIGGVNFTDLAFSLGTDPAGKEVLWKYGNFLQITLPVPHRRVRAVHADPRHQQAQEAGPGRAAAAAARAGSAAARDPRPAREEV